MDVALLPATILTYIDMRLAPYMRSRTHAADVLRTLYVLLTHGGVLKATLPENQDIGLMACLLAAIVHDFEHRGLNNDFLVKSADPLAVSSGSSSWIPCMWCLEC